MALITVYYDERKQEILTEDELADVADEYNDDYEAYIDKLKEYDLWDLWEMLRPEMQQRIISEARKDYIKENCISKVIDV